MVQKGHVLRFLCVECQNPIQFSVLESQLNSLVCIYCEKTYSFIDSKLKRQLQKFERLCRQIADSEEILSHTNVGIDVGERKIKIPFKLLLTRFNNSLELEIGGAPLSIDFRLEPLNDC